MEALPCTKCFKCDKIPTNATLYLNGRKKCNAKKTSQYGLCRISHFVLILGLLSLVVLLLDFLSIGIVLSGFCRYTRKMSSIFEPEITAAF